MADIHDLNENTPAKTPAGSGTKSSEAEQTHRRVEHEATKLAERGKEREKKEDPEEFSNIGPA